MTLVLAMILDALFGEPRWIWDRWPHPAVVMGRLIGWADARWNQGVARKAKGIALVLGMVCLSLSVTFAITHLPGIGPLAEVLLGAALLAQKSLVSHVRAVADALHYGVPEGRSAVAMIVGRDTSAMTETDVARAAIESAAENLSDGVVAPLFWFALLGLPGLVAYKLVNTADSMIGYRTPQYAAFGWAAARLDDLLNFVPARLTALMIALAMGRLNAVRVAVQDAPLHRSPNAGWPEGAMAGALGIALSGPRSYHGQRQDLPWVNANGKRMLNADDIETACDVLWRVWWICLAGAGILALG